MQLLIVKYSQGRGTKFLIKKFLITEFLITKFPIIKFLIDKVSN
jgi:hypothetical protein